MKCPECSEYPAEPPHECPYRSEINGDPAKCTCCERCTEVCNQEV